MGIVYLEAGILWILMAMAGGGIGGLIIREYMLRKYAKPLLIFARARRFHEMIVMTHTVGGNTELLIPKLNENGMLTFKMNNKKQIMYDPKRDPEAVEHLYSVPLIHYMAGYPEAIVSRGVMAVQVIREMLTADPNLKDYTDERLLFWILKDEHWKNVENSASKIDPEVFQELCEIREFLKDYELPAGYFTYPSMMSLLSPTNSTSHVLNLISKVQERCAKMGEGVDTWIKALMTGAVAVAIVVVAAAVANQIIG